MVVREGLSEAVTSELRHKRPRGASQVKVRVWSMPLWTWPKVEADTAGLCKAGELSGFMQSGF